MRRRHGGNLDFSAHDNENAALKFSVTSKGEDVNKKPRSRESIAFHNQGNAAMIVFNPLRPNNDVSQTSHCNIKGV